MGMVGRRRSDEGRAVMEALAGGPLPFEAIQARAGVEASTVKSIVGRTKRSGHARRTSEGWELTKAGAKAWAVEKAHLARIDAERPNGHANGLARARKRSRIGKIVEELKAQRSQLREELEVVEDMIAAAEKGLQ